MKKLVDGQYIEMTAEEVAERQEQETKNISEMNALQEIITQKETDKLNGKKKLKDLGLTDAEVDALIGS
tara:strand:- start:307 stop:513 length:207 start_codon:yes stop_codon:yes gene_type:complete